MFCEPAQIFCRMLNDTCYHMLHTSANGLRTVKFRRVQELVSSLRLANNL